MVRQYEVVYIIDSALEEPVINERLERYHARVKLTDSEASQISRAECRSFRHFGPTYRKLHDVRLMLQQSIVHACAPINTHLI